MNNLVALYKKIISVVFMVCICGFILTGCNKTVEEPEEVVTLTTEDNKSVYETVKAEYRDVFLHKELSVRYRQTSEQNVSFNVGGKRIEKVYVRVGDTVKKGDILAELSEGNIEEDIAYLEYKIAKNKKQIEYLEAWKEFELGDSYQTFSYRSGFSEEDIKDHDERDEGIEESYHYSQEDYEDEIEMDSLELSKLKQQLASSQLHATMSGTVYSIVDDLEGSTSKKDEVIMTIIDGTSGMFVANDKEFSNNFIAGEPISMSITYGSAKGEYEVMPYNMGAWGEEQYFTVCDGPENDGIEVDTSGTMHVVLDKREHVLSVPLGSVYEADGKSYVYVPDENGFKSIKWVTKGLVGDNYIEIIEGLKEGETIVRR